MKITHLGQKGASPVLKLVVPGPPEPNGSAACGLHNNSWATGLFGIYSFVSFWYVITTYSRISACMKMIYECSSYERMNWNNSETLHQILTAPN